MSDDVIGEVMSAEDAAEAIAVGLVGDDAHQDALALDMVAEVLRLPAWQVNGSAADFIECIANVVARVRDLTRPAPEWLLRESGFEAEADRIAMRREMEQVGREMHPERP